MNLRTLRSDPWDRIQGSTVKVVVQVECQQRQHSNKCRFVQQMNVTGSRTSESTVPVTLAVRAMEAQSHIDSFANLSPGSQT